MSFSAQNQTQTDLEIQELLTMLTYKRRHGSKGEEMFFEKFARSLKDHSNVTGYYEDPFGNAFVEVAGGSALGFSSHCDTVHSMPKPGESEFQQVLYDAEMQMIYKDDNQPLGADDGSGVWVLRRIADAGIPCSLFFFRGEEVGGLGSSWAAKNDPEYFKQFDMAIAFDRRGTGDIITHQSCGRCASDKWAKALSAQLNSMGLDYAPCSGGIFTDTANLASLIPECSNTSTAYFSEHSGNETQDVDHLLKLRDAVLKVDWSALPIERDPSIVEYDDDFGWYKSVERYKSKSKYEVIKGGLMDDDDIPEEAYEYIPAVVEDDLYYMNLAAMVEAAQDYPEDFATAVYQLVWGKQS